MLSNNNKAWVVYHFEKFRSVRLENSGREELFTIYKKFRLVRLKNSERGERVPFLHTERLAVITKIVGCLELL